MQLIETIRGRQQSFHIGKKLYYLILSGPLDFRPCLNSSTISNLILNNCATVSLEICSIYPYHFQFFGLEFPDDGGDEFVALLRVHQLVALLDDDRLGLSPVGRLLVKLLAEIERDRSVLESRVGRQRVLAVVFFGQLHHRRHGVAHFPG